MSVIEAIILGIIQGLTEFLPVSSSGHLAIANQLFGLEDGKENLLMTVVVHAGTALSTIVVFRKHIGDLFKGLLLLRWNEQTQYLVKIGLSMIPVLIVGLFFKEYVEQIFGSGLLIVGCSLFATAIVLFFAYKAKARSKKEIGFKDACIIGLAQMVAILPGLSRSGATIATGLLLGNPKESVARFSFLMVLIPILGEALLDCHAVFTQTTSTVPVTALLAGFGASLIMGMVACKWMIKIVQKGKLIYFSIYCAIAAVLTVIISWL
jgi:undecaprenyl-diphosphatase